MPEDDCGSDCDSGQEGVGASVIACVYPPPVLEFGEHVFNFVPLTVEVFIKADG